MKTGSLMISSHGFTSRSVTDHTPSQKEGVSGSISTKSCLSFSATIITFLPLTFGSSPHHQA